MIVYHLTVNQTICDMLVFALSVTGFPYWPAKLMAINGDKNTVDVQFFGDHKRMVVTPKDCFIYSKVCPSVNIGSLKNMFDMAIDVRLMILFFNSKNVYKI